MLEDRPEDVLQRVAANVRALRKAAGMTVKVAAERSEMHWRHLQKIETGEVNVTVHSLVRVALALRVDVEVLFRKHPQLQNGAAPS